MEERPQRALSLRAVVLGLVVAALVNVWIAWSEHILHSSRMNLSHFPLALFVGFLVLTIPLNIILKRINVRFGFSPSELLVVVAMGLAAASVPASGLTGYFLGVIATPYYFASPENRWAEYFHPHIPGWLAPKDTGGAMRWFFEGIPHGQRIPWEVWVVPLFWWLTMIAAIILVGTCIAVLLRKQWSRNERLAYPLVTVAQEMVSGAEERRLLPGFMRGKLFWMGFAVSFGIISWNILTYFWTAIPAIPVLGAWRTIHPNLPEVHSRINFFTIGVSYFANPEVLFSVWVFYLVFMIQSGLLSRIGFEAGKMGDWWSSYDVTTTWTAFGAFVFLVAIVVWNARKHLKDAVLKAVKGNPALDDSDELLSYRTALIGLLVGLVYIYFWFRKAGMDPAIVLLFLFATLVIHIAVSRIVAESGVLYVRGPISAQSFAVYSVGADVTSSRAFTALAFSYAIIANGRGLFQPALIHTAKLAEAIRANKRSLCLAILVGLTFGILVSIAFSIHLGYSRGALNFLSNVFNLHAQKVFDFTVSKINNPFPRAWNRLALLGAGIAITGGLTALRMIFSWWPLHPIGFAISANYLTRFAALSIFIAWLTKTIILKIGGVEAYRKSKPFFLGLLSGYAFAVALSFLVDAIWFVGKGHRIHSW